MSLSQLHIADKAILDVSDKHQIFRFENRIKCLNSIFWSLYSNLENSQKSLLVVEQHEDWEYLNYLLSFYNVSPLVLKLQNEEKVLSKPALEKIRTQNLKLSEPSSERDDEDLDFVYSHLQRSVDQIFSPIISNLNLLDIIQKLAMQREAMPYIFSQSYRLITMNEVKTKKQLLSAAQSIYSSDFKFIDQYHPLSASALQEYTTESIQVILNDLLIELTELLGRVQVIQNKLTYQNHSKSQQEFDKIQLAFNELNDKINNQGYVACFEDEEFIATLQKTAHWLNSAVDLEKKLEDELAKLKGSFSRAVKSFEIERTKQSEFAWNNYNRTNAAKEDVNTFNAIDKYLVQLDEIQILRDWIFKRPNTLKDYSLVIEELRAVIEHAIYHCNNISAYDKWNSFISSLSLEDKQLIEDLRKSSADWPEVFEYSYLKYYIEFKSNAIDPIAGRVEKLNNLIGKLPEKRSNEILNNFYLNRSNEEILLNKEGNMYQFWDNFLMEKANELCNKFPILIVDKAFFEQNISFLVAHFEHLLTVNYLPKHWPNEEWIFNKITGYSNAFLEATKSIRKASDLIQVVNIKGVEFNVNRSRQEHSSNDLSQLSLYIGEELKRINPDFRIFQFKDVSVISFLRNQLNAHVMEQYAHQGMKEIFHSQEDYNLLPGIFSNQDQEIIILLEDNLINNKRKDLPLSQLLLIEKLKILDVKLISFDNFEFIKNENLAIEKLVQSIRPVNLKESIVKS